MEHKRDWDLAVACTVEMYSMPASIHFGSGKEFGEPQLLERENHSPSPVPMSASTATSATTPPG